MTESGLNMSRRIRRTPFTDKVEAHGARGFSVVNRMLLPKAFATSVEDDYRHLREHVQIWDVSCQRQVEIGGPDAERLVQWMTPRDVSGARVGQCLYLPLTDERGGMLNDPVLLKLGPERFRLSIADSDILLWAKGLALGRGLAAEVEEPDVSPLAIQGPKAEDLLARVFGEHVRRIGFFRFGRIEFRGTEQIVSRSGYSKQGGFEIYLEDSSLGPALWDEIWRAGKEFNLRAGCPNLIERIEGGLLSYGNEMTRDNNPFECGLSSFCDLENPTEFLGREALRKVRAEGHRREMRGVVFGGPPCPQCVVPWPVLATTGERPEIGRITSGIHSPRLKSNIGLSMIERDFWRPGQEVLVRTADDEEREGRVTGLPFA